MCELQVLDDNYEKATGNKIDPRQAHGSVYGMVAAQRGYQRPIGEWNFQEVTVKGSKIKVELNGMVILDGDVAAVKEFMGNRPHPGKDRTRGYFGFAGHNDPVRLPERRDSSGCSSSNHMFVETPARPSPDAKSFRFLRLSEPRIKWDS